jgi:5-methylcytosine-specific restriction enzyme B
MTEATELPTFHAYVEPTLEVLRGADGAMENAAIERAVVKRMGLSEEAARLPHDPAKPGRSEVGYRVAWARTYLKKAGLIDNASRGAWIVTDKGREATLVDGRAIYAEVSKGYRTVGADGTTASAASPAPSRELSSHVVARLTKARDALAASGDLFDRRIEAEALRRFRERFGPEVLARLDGEALLGEMHGRGTKDSLVYWLEFKNDDVFPARFGSIGGGSALKFGIYQSADSGSWMSGSGRAPTVLSVEEAVDKARRQRDQLVGGAEVLAARAGGAPAENDFEALQSEMLERAPDVAETSWGHKYFSLLFPSLIPPIHGTEYQRHQLIKCLSMPCEGRYENDGQFTSLAASTGMSSMDLATALHHLHGGPHAYWRVGTTAPTGSEWTRMRDGDFVAVGWSELGDLSDLEKGPDGKARLREMMAERFPGPAKVVSKNANQVHRFVREPAERDLFVVMEGATVLGIARPDGDYYFESGDGPFAHRRRVTWLSVETWKLPTLEAPRTTFVSLGKYPENLIEVERRLLAPVPRPGGPRATRPPGGPSSTRPAVGMSALPPLAPVVRRVQAVLERKGQVILYGPPGTGKTYWAERAAFELAARRWFGKSRDQLADGEREELQSRAVEICAFHPAYGYEDFLEGYRPVEKAGRLTYEARDGVFKRLCARARENRGRPHYLIVDEINRGDIPRIFGELLTVLEKDKRNQSVTLPLSGERWAIPENVFLLGTMNTADRSIALLDAALRRRFGFVELMPNASALDKATVKGLPLGGWLDALNALVMEHAGRDARNLQIGHAYLMNGGRPVADVARLAEVVRDDIIPLLEEYCYEDYAALAKILGPILVDAKRQRINAALFEPDRHDELIEALIAAAPAIITTKAAVEVTPDDEEDEEDDDGEEG